MSATFRVAAKTFFVALVALGVFGCSSESAPKVENAEQDLTQKTGTAESAGESAPATMPRVPLTYAELQAALKEDSHGKKFEGKELEITGVVEGVGISNGPYILLNRARVDTKDKEPWAKVLTGQTVKLLGTYSYNEGLVAGILEASGDRLVQPATDLAVAAKGDKDATDAKYQGKTLEVDGKVQKASKSDAGYLQVLLEGAEDTPLECVFPAFNQETEVLMLKPGDDVRIVGLYSPTGKDNMPSIVACLLITE